MQQDQGLALAGNTMIQFNGHALTASGDGDEPDTLPSPDSGARRN
jgi:hypothetical protein